jgi:protein-disulfide isomerase
MQSEATNQRLTTDRKLADELGVKGTPTIFINGREYVTKLDLEEWIDNEIAAAKSRETR